VEAREQMRRAHPSAATAEFGYPAEGGAEFVHGEAPVTHGLVARGGLSPAADQGYPMTAEDGKLRGRHLKNFMRRSSTKLLRELRTIWRVAEFLRRYFRHPQYDRFRRSIERDGRGYDGLIPSGQYVWAFSDDGWMAEGVRKRASPAATAPSVDLFWPRECRKARAWQPSHLICLRHRAGQILEGHGPLRRRRRS